MRGRELFAAITIGGAVLTGSIAKVEGQQQIPATLEPTPTLIGTPLRNINIRECPSVSCNIVSVLSPDNPGNVIGEVTVRDPNYPQWVIFKQNESITFAAADNVSVEGTPTDLTEVAAIEQIDGNSNPTGNLLYQMAQTNPQVDMPMIKAGFDRLQTLGVPAETFKAVNLRVMDENGNVFWETVNIGKPEGGQNEAGSVVVIAHPKLSDGEVITIPGFFGPGQYADVLKSVGVELNGNEEFSAENTPQGFLRYGNNLLDYDNLIIDLNEGINQAEAFRENTITGQIPDSNTSFNVDFPNGFINSETGIRYSFEADPLTGIFKVTKIESTFNMDAIRSTLDSESLANMNKMVANYPGGDEKMVLTDAKEQGIIVQRWDSDLLTLVGKDSKTGETLYYFPHLTLNGVTGDMTSNPNPDSKNGWVRPDGQLVTTDFVEGKSGFKMVIFTGRGFMYQGQELVEPVDQEYVTQNLINVLGQNVIKEFGNDKKGNVLIGVTLPGTVNVSSSANEAMTQMNDLNPILSYNNPDQYVGGGYKIGNNWYSYIVMNTKRDWNFYNSLGANNFYAYFFMINNPNNPHTDFSDLNFNLQLLHRLTANIAKESNVKENNLYFLAPKPVN